MIIHSNKDHAQEYFEAVCQVVNRKAGEKVAAIDGSMAHRPNASIVLEDIYISLFVDDNNFLLLEIGRNDASDVGQLRLDRFLPHGSAANVLSAAYMAKQS